MSSAPAWPPCDVRLQWLYASQERAEQRTLEQMHAMEEHMQALHLYVDSLERKLSSRLSPSPPPSDDDDFISGVSPQISRCKRRKFNPPRDKKKTTPRIEKVMTICKNKQLYEYLRTVSQSRTVDADWSPLCTVVFVLLLIYIFRRIHVYYDSSRESRCRRDPDVDRK